MRSIYYYQDAGIQKVGGYYRSAGKLTYLIVPKAGHLVPTTNLEVTKLFLADYIKS